MIRKTYKDIRFLKKKLNPDRLKKKYPKSIKGIGKTLSLLGIVLSLAGYFCTLILVGLTFLNRVLHGCSLDSAITLMGVQILLFTIGFSCIIKGFSVGKYSILKIKVKRY